MLINKKALSLFLLVASSNVVCAAQVVESSVQNELNFLAKADVSGLLRDKSNINFAQERNLAKDLNFEEMANYFECKTLSGKQFLKEALSLPINTNVDAETVVNRQRLIEELCKDAAFKAQVEALVLQYQAQEQAVFKLTSQEFRGAVCPEEFEKPLKYPRYEYGKKTVKNLLKAGLAGYFTYVFAKSNYVLYKNVSVMGQLTLGQKKAIFGINGAINLFTAYLLAGYSKELTKDYLAAYKKRNQVHALSELVSIAQQLEQLCNDKQVGVQFKLDRIINKDSVDLINTLKKSRYTQAQSYAFLTPSVHALVYEIYKKEGCFADIFACLAQYDACNAIATKMIATQNQKNQFCFAQFIKQPKPQINAISYWNILVGEQKAVGNDLCENKNIILSGVNAGGKTTATRAILQNIVLAQTFGVAAANSFELTAFDVIHSYLNISDDLVNGSSLFVSEVKRAQEVKAVIDEITGTSLKYFFALDELFTGTGADAGERCACDFVGGIANSENAMFIYPTHFDKLKELGSEHANCVNYKVDTAVKRNDGSLVYPFTVTPGASYDNIALDIAKNANLFN